MEEIRAKIKRKKELDETCEYKFKIYRIGWEGDNVGWVMKDGTIYTTSLGEITTMTRKQFDKYRLDIMEEYRNLQYISGLL